VDAALTAIIKKNGKMSQEFTHHDKREPVAEKRDVRDVY